MLRVNMSKHETHLTRRFWESVGGALVEEYPAVQKGSLNAQRLMDGVIILDTPNQIVKANEVSLEGKDVIVIQTKASRLGMYLMGQAYFSKILISDFKPKSIRTVAICTQGDSVLEPIAKANGIEVVIYKES
jgi:hypothetical protein